jgi:hypothetical protein
MSQCANTMELKYSSNIFIDIGECDYINSIHVDAGLLQYARYALNIMVLFLSVFLAQLHAVEIQSLNPLLSKF